MTLATRLKFNEEKFLELYLERYWLEWETIKECFDRCLNKHWLDEKENFDEWKAMVAKCLPKWSDKKTYKVRSWWKESVLDKCANSLWLECSPKFNLK